MIKKIRIGNKHIGENEPTFIIAEAGSNHDGNINQAKELIDIASECKADAIKFQLFKAESFYKINDPMFEVMKENEFPREWMKELHNYTQKKNIIFLASAFDNEAVDLLQEYNSPAFKIASSEITNLSLLRYVALNNKPLILSTAMCNIADIYEAIDVINSTGNNDIILLQCSALYPTEAQYINLRVMGTLKCAFNLSVGYSDHTLGIHIPAAAVGMGACVIEKHFTISRKLKGPDHSYAIEPKELQSMIENIREVEKSLGSPIKKMLNEEKSGARRESIYAKGDISKGMIITNELLEIRRPAIGIEPRLLRAIIGLKSIKNIKAGEMIDWDMIK